MLRRLEFQAVGNGQHRSGWPYCLQQIDSLFSKESPIVLDDFVERTFFYDSRNLHRYWHRRPWVGIFHHPPDLPEWYKADLRLQNLARDVRWARSLPNLRLIVTMGENLQTWCQERWPKIPCVVIKHPTGLPQFYWSPERFMQRQRKTLLQVGWFLRNMIGIRQVAVPADFDKAQLRPTNEWVPKMTDACETYYDQHYPHRRDIGHVEVLQAVDDIAYDELLAESVVFMEVIAAVANNTVVECMIRNTPLCVNRHPGPVAYLGEDYPLFYDRLEEVPELLTIANIMKAHHYLRQLDKWWIHGPAFREQLRAACIQHVPECRMFTTQCHDRQ